MENRDAGKFTSTSVYIIVNSKEKVNYHKTRKWDGVFMHNDSDESHAFSVYFHHRTIAFSPWIRYTGFDTVGSQNLPTAGLYYFYRRAL